MKLEFISEEFYALSDFEFSNLPGRRYVVFDVESTGANPKSDNITQIGAIAIYDSGPSDREFFSSFVKPRKPIPQNIEALTGVTNTLVSKAPDFQTAWPKFHEFCADSVLVTQCGFEFDFPILEEECYRAKTDFLKNDRLDTKTIFALMHPQRTENFTTNFLSDYYSVDRTPFKRHDALGDARLIARIFSAELAEMRSLKMDSIAAASPFKIKRFALPPL